MSEGDNHSFFNPHFCPGWSRFNTCFILTQVSLSELYSGGEMLRHYYSCHSSNRFLQIGRDRARHFYSPDTSRLTPAVVFFFFPHILINHLNYNTKISAKVTPHLTFIWLRYNINMQVLINQRAFFFFQMWTVLTFQGTLNSDKNAK